MNGSDFGRAIAPPAGGAVDRAAGTRISKFGLKAGESPISKAGDSSGAGNADGEIAGVAGQRAPRRYWGFSRAPSRHEISRSSLTGLLRKASAPPPRAAARMCSSG